MTRRILAALAALIVLAAGSLMWAQPVAAAPGGACGLEEWRDPGNFLDCTKRAGTSAADTATCVTAPDPSSPTSGFAGSFASQPDTAKRPGVAGTYSTYGAAGYGLDSYDLGCLGTLKHPDLSAWNTIATMQFKTAAGILGAANALRERAYDPGSVWTWSDGFVESVTRAIYEYVFNVFGVIAIALLGVYLIWTARQGRLSRAMKMLGWAIFVIVVTTGIARWPSESVQVADDVTGAGLSTLHSVVGPGPQNLPAEQCALGGDACTDHRSVATRTSDTVTETILYRTWLRAVLGDNNSETARKYGPALFDATTLTWGQAAMVDQGTPELRTNILEQKARTWNTIAAAIRVEDPVAYEHLQGLHGGDRAAAGFTAWAAAGAFATFDVAASMVILFGYALFRFAVMLLPLVGTIAVFMPASGPFRRIGNVAFAAAINIIVFGAAGGAYLALVNAVFHSAIPGWLKIVIVVLAAVVLWWVTQPHRQVISTITGRPSGKPTLINRAMQAGKKTVTEAWTATADDRAAAGQATRPETVPQAPRTPAAVPPAAEARPEGVVAGTARRLATVGVTAAAGPVVGAAAAAATRPETSTRS